MENLNGFLHLYFYQLEQLLNADPSSLNGIKFQSEEANTDEFLKIFFKSFMLKHNRIKNEFNFDVEVKSLGQTTNYKFEDLANFQIQEVLLPSELTAEHKEDITAQKSGVYTKPDLYINISNKQQSTYLSIELKSTKTNKIPGSSVQQISPYEWVVFVQHTTTAIKTTTGVYLNSITEKLPFPDRSPRPQIGFDTLELWNSKNRTANNNILRCTYTDEIEKNLILKDWHSCLVKEWMQTIKKDSKKKGEKWFNHTLRLYSSALLNYYDTLSEDEQKKLKDTLDDLIK